MLTVTSIRRVLLTLTLSTSLLAACGTAAVFGPVESGPLRLRLTGAQLSGALPQTLQITATFENDTDTVFRSSGCLRPIIVIDTATATGGWSPINVNQLEELALCIQPYNVSPRSSNAFETTFSTTAQSSIIPRGRLLRLRVKDLAGADGPTATVTLPR